MKTTLAALLVALCASTATAEPLKIPLAIYVSAAALDLHSTHRFLQYQGIHEANPLGGWLEDSPKTLIVFSALADASIVYGLHRWIGPKHPRIERVALYSAAAVRIAMAGRNYRNVNGLTPR